MALVALVAMPLLSHPARGIPAGAPGVYSSMQPGYPTDDPIPNSSPQGAWSTARDSPSRESCSTWTFIPLRYTTGMHGGLPVVPLDAVVSATDGSFSVHLNPNAAIQAVADANGGVAEFVFGPRISGFQFTMGDFSLQIEGDRFTALPGPITIVIDTRHPLAPVTVPPSPFPRRESRAPSPPRTARWMTRRSDASGHASGTNGHMTQKPGLSQPKPKNDWRRRRLRRKPWPLGG